MVLIIGGAGQGKLDYALAMSGAAPSDVAVDFTSAHNARVFYKFHLAVRHALELNRDPFADTDALIAANPNIIIICDEIGGGLVPVDPFHRLWRDSVGRICCVLARSASNVERVFCGLPLPLKGDGSWN